MGKIATLKQAAAIGNVSLSEIINTLRLEVGQALFDETGIESEINETEPVWFNEEIFLLITIKGYAHYCQNMDNKLFHTFFFQN